jgi:hypothetical protein
MPLINEVIQKAEKDYGLGKGEYFKVQEGANKIRVLSELVFNQNEYDGKIKSRFVCWILDRKDQVIKPYFMPVTIARALGSMQENPEYAFKDFPMPYDITINAKGAGSKEVDYQVVAARQNTPLTDLEEMAMKERTPIVEFVAKLTEKQGGKGVSVQDEAPPLGDNEIQ